MKAKKGSPASPDLNHFVTPLLKWYSKNGRSLPWRKTKDPYAIWISEVVLQQTQVIRGKVYYERFLQKFSNIQSLAKARWPSLLQVWRGLGYYQRAKNLSRAAKILVLQYDGALPMEREDLLKLPGIGPYTASAIQSFAFNTPVPAVDTNLARVFQRYFGCTKSQVENRANELFRLKPRSGKKLNYALMDLGAMVCVARTPLCMDCPLERTCHYRQTNTGEATRPSFGQRKKQKKSHLPKIQVGIACIHDERKYLLAKRVKIKGGNWEFPGGKREGNESVRATIKREVKEELGIEVAVRPPFHTESFSDATFNWSLQFCRCQILHGTPKALEHERLQWVKTEELQLYGMPKMNDIAVKKLQRMR